MSLDRSQIEEASTIRSAYNRAMAEACKVYYDSEEIAAFLVLDIFRLENMKRQSESDEQHRAERIAEKFAMLARTKENMWFILAKLQELARERDTFVSDIYTSSRIVDLESRLSDLTPWVRDLSTEVQARAETARINAKVSMELSQARQY